MIERRKLAPMPPPMREPPRRREYGYMVVCAVLLALYSVAGTMDYQDAVIREKSRTVAVAAPCTWLKQSGGTRPARLACVNADLSEKRHASR